MSEILQVGVSHRTAPVAVRERVARDLRGREALARRALASPGVREALVLSTCNRTEVYAVLEASERKQVETLLRGALLEPVATGNGRSPLDLTARRFGRDAIAHAFRVASGVDSMVLGEPEILGQVGDALAEARDRGEVGPVLRRLFAGAIRTARDAHRLTAISEGAASVGSVAVALAGKVFEDLPRRTALLVGAGQVGATIAKTLWERRIGRLFIAGRSRDRAADLARSVGAQAMALEQALERLSDVDIVLCAAAVSGAESVIPIERVKDVRRDRPLLLIDVGLPRNLDPRIGELPDVFLYSLDDLEQVAGEAARRRRKELPRVERLIESGVERFERWFGAHRDVGPLIHDIHARARRILEGELARTLPRIPPEHRPAVERLGKSLVEKILQEPTVRLKRGSDRFAGRLDLVRDLFGLESEDAGRDRGREP